MAQMGSKTKIVAGGGSVIALIAALTGSMEGVRTTAYHDLARPEIATICYGETEGVYFGETKTKAECMLMLEKSLPKYLATVDKTLPGLPVNRRVAYSDFAYNEGQNRFINSRMVRYERLGMPQAACGSLLFYNTANGKVLNGLTHRRQKEKEICLQNISSID